MGEETAYERELSSTAHPEHVGGLAMRADLRVLFMNYGHEQFRVGHQKQLGGIAHVEVGSPEAGVNCGSAKCAWMAGKMTRSWDQTSIATPRTRPQRHRSGMFVGRNLLEIEILFIGRT
jgi:hypothetical protein